MKEKTAGQDFQDVFAAFQRLQDVLEEFDRIKLPPIVEIDPEPPATPIRQTVAERVTGWFRSVWGRYRAHI